MAIFEQFLGAITPFHRKKTEPYTRIPENIAAPTVPYERPVRPIDRDAPTEPVPPMVNPPVIPTRWPLARPEILAPTRLLFGIAGDVDLRLRRTLAGSASLEEFTKNLELTYPSPELRSFLIDYFKFLIGDETLAARFSNQADFAASLSGLHPQVEAYLLAQFSYLASDNRASTVGTDQSSGQIEYPHFVPVDTEVVEQYIQDELAGILDAIHTAAMHTVNAPHTLENSQVQGSAWQRMWYRVHSYFQRSSNRG